MKTLKYLSMILLISFAAHATESSLTSAIPSNTYPVPVTSVRRLLLYIHQSLSQGLIWTVFEPNTAQLRAAIKMQASSFLHTLWLQGALMGATPAEAYAVDCIASPEDIENNRVILKLKIAAVYPSEFILMDIKLAVAPKDDTKRP